MAGLIKYADRMGIARLCVYMGMKWSYDPSPEDFRQQNDEVLQALSHWHDRAFGFVYVSPKHVKDLICRLHGMSPFSFYRWPLSHSIVASRF